MAYDHPVILRLLMDDRFREWVNYPTPELDRYWKQRLRHHPEEQQGVERARHVLRYMDFTKSQDIDRAGILAKAWDRARQSEAAAPPLVSFPRASKRTFASRYWYQIAAVLIGLALVIGYQYYLLSDRVHTTAYGESKHVVLPDGSTVMLNANSELRYERTWPQHQPRRVKLTGEAFFSVTHQTDDQKFVVQANDLAIEVLGTEFNVNHRRGETAVMLQQGRVRLDWSASERAVGATADTTRQLTIKPGELVVFSADTLTRKEVNPHVYASWTDNEWRFEQTPLSEVITMIEDNYGYRVIAEEALVADKVFTAEIHEADLDLLLAFLSESFDLAIIQYEQTITFQHRKAKAP